MSRRAVALAAVLLLAAPALAGCLDVGDPGEPLSGGPVERVGLTEPVLAFGAFLAQEFASFDGTPIHVDVQLPEAEGPFPVLVQYTPYSNNLNYGNELWGLGSQHGAEGATAGTQAEGLVGFALADYYVPRGYAVAIAHVRGSGQSGGCFSTGGAYEAQDGYELVEWLAAQEWSNGRVALMGTSYVGTTPISTATLDPPHLTTIVPVSAVTEWYRYYFENGEPRFFGELPFGVVYTDQPLWASIGFIPKPRNPTAVPSQESADCAYAQLEAAYTQDDYDAYWMERNYLKDVGNATAPMLYAHGFLDENTPTSLVTDFFNAYPGEKRMWLQQHGHGVPGSFEAYHLAVHQWLDHWMLDRENGALDMPAVVVQDNRGEYHTLPEWPLRGGPEVAFHLAPDGLVADAPAESSASYTDDARALEELRDLLPSDGTLLTFATAPLDAPLHLSGAPVLRLVASSTATDTQFAALLFDEAPDGSRAFVTRGYLDARHRESLEAGADVKPGEAAVYEWALHSRDHHLDEGHRLVLVVKSSDKYVLPDAPGATNTLHFGPEGSRLTLPVLDLASTGFTAEAPWSAP